MIDQLVIDSKPDCETTSSLTTPSNGVNSSKQSNTKVSNDSTSNKLAKVESTDSGYGSFDKCSLQSPCHKEFLIDESARHSFGSIHEVDESAMDMYTTAMSFSRDDTDNDQEMDLSWSQNELQNDKQPANSPSTIVCGSDASELSRAMDACNSPEKTNEMSFYDNTPLSSPLPCSISPSESSLMLHENLPTDFTITPSSDIERRPFSEVVFNTLDTSATTKSACRKLKFIEPSGTAPKRMDSPRTPPARLSPKNLGSIFQPLNSIGESSNSNDDYDMELLEMDSMEDPENMPPANFDSVIHGQMTHLPLRRGVSLNDSVSSSRRNRQSLSSDALEGVSSLGENSPPFVMHGFKRSERGVCSPINSKRWKSETEGKENVQQARPLLQKSFSMIDSSLNIMKALEKADLGLIGDHSKPFCLPITNGKQRDLTCISVHTMARLLNGDFTNTVNSYRVIDCRYPYEFEGGHIRGAENLYTEDDIYRVLMSTKTETATVVPVEPKRNIIIFHCEFSSHRGPKLAKFLRTKDRDANNEIYPALHYPEIYLLDGGYKEFYKFYTDLCDPKTYLPMLEPAYDSYYKHFRAATKSWNGGDRVTLSRTGKSRSRLLL